MIFMRFDGDDVVKVEVPGGTDCNRRHGQIIPEIMKVTSVINGRLFAKERIVGVEVVDKFDQLFFRDTVRIGFFRSDKLSLNVFVKFPGSQIQKDDPVTVFAGIVSIRSSLPRKKIGIIANNDIHTALQIGDKVFQVPLMIFVQFAYIKAVPAIVHKKFIGGVINDLQSGRLQSLSDAA